MTFVAPGDLVFSFYDTRIQAIGVVQQSAIDAPKPNFGTAGKYWDDIGWLVEVEFHPLDEPFRPKDRMDLLRSHLPSKYSPLSSEGNGSQSIYLTEVPDGLASQLIHLAKVNPSHLLSESFKGIEVAEDQLVLPPDISAMDAKVARGALERFQLQKSRSGQGIFKHNVRLYEDRCRVTGVSNIRHLRASHIKPWSRSTDNEKIDGANGLLLAPHVDHLFDRGFISFEKDGTILRSDVLEESVLERWALDSIRRVSPFSEDQEKYLKHHRSEILIAS
jgi:hypothetical protein